MATARSSLARLLLAVSLCGVPALASGGPGEPRLQQPPTPLPEELFRGFVESLSELQRFNQRLASSLASGGRLLDELDKPVAEGDHEELARRQRALAEMLETALPALDGLIGRTPRLLGNFDAGIADVRAIGHELRVKATPACVAARDCRGRWCEIDQRMCTNATTLAGTVDGLAEALTADRERLDALLAEMAEARATLRRASELGRSMSHASEDLYQLFAGGGDVSELRNVTSKIEDTLALLHGLFRHPDIFNRPAELAEPRAGRPR